MAMDDGEKATAPAGLTGEVAAWLTLKTVRSTWRPRHHDRRCTAVGPPPHLRQPGLRAHDGLPDRGRDRPQLPVPAGPDTDPSAVAEIRAALAERRPCVVEILNYRRDGTTFWNRLSITPVRDGAGEVTHFIGVQSDVTDRRVAEDGLRLSKEAVERDLRLAARVQQALLPPSDLRPGTLCIATRFTRATIWPATA